MIINNFKIHFVFFLLFSFAFTSSTTAQNKDSCICSLKYNNKIIQLQDDFWKVFQELNNLSIIENERLSMFMLFINHPFMLSYYMGSRKTCNERKIKFLNESICDTSAKIILTYYQSPVKIKDTIKVFDKQLFDNNVFNIRDSAYVALKKAFPWFNIYIQVSGLSRTLKEQEEFYKSGSSTTLLSAHNLGAAADFTIYFNGFMINPAPHEYNIYNSLEPYRILGKFILDKGYFWGIPWDPGHMQVVRRTTDLLLQYPEFQENGNVISFYADVIKQDFIPLKYKPAIEILDHKFNMNQIRVYDEKQPWIEDTLIKPITVDKKFKSKYFW